MDQSLSIQVGTVAVATRTTGVCDADEPGVCYEIYELGGRPGYSFIFRSGRYDGFSPDDVDKFLHVTNKVCMATAEYQFRNVNRLVLDFTAGFFDPAFPLVSAPPSPSPS